MITANLHPLVGGKTPIKVNGQMGVYYDGQFVPVIEIDGEYFTEHTRDELLTKCVAANPGWDWGNDESAAVRNTESWPSAPVDPASRTMRMSRANSPSNRLLSNDRPLELEPEDEASLLREIAAMPAEPKDA